MLMKRPYCRNIACLSGLCVNASTYGTLGRFMPQTPLVLNEIHWPNLIQKQLFDQITLSLVSRQSWGSSGESAVS